MFSKRKMNKKLDLLLKRQALMAQVLFLVELDEKYCKKFEKKFNDLWFEIMEGKDGKRS